jgi:23S rRNA (uracil1939-C5)-methyltransferase
MTEVVEITALGHSGDGIAETGGVRVFVPFTLPGETVTIERSGNRGRLLRVDRASPVRVAPSCRHFGACGGCALQHMEREAYLAWKRETVAKSFALSGVDTAVEPVAPIPLGSRRRAVFTAVRTARGIVLGFQRRSSNEVIPVEECPVLVPAIATRLGLLREIAGFAAKPRRPVRIAVLAADNGLDIAVAGGGRPDARILSSLGSLGREPALARLTLDGREILMSRRPEIDVGGVALLPPAGGFVQASAAAEAALAEAVLAHVGDARPVLDLFAGCGTFSLRLARRAPVTAVEGDAALLAALDEAARRSRGLRPLTTRRRDLFHNPMAPEELSAYSAVVFDPPAAGAKAQSEALARSHVPTVAAVSCNAATLARDARILIGGGYRLDRVLPVDQFLFSPEIEVVATFSR